jgi:hypothetical protein
MVMVMSPKILLLSGHSMEIDNYITCALLPIMGIKEE